MAIPNHIAFIPDGNRRWADGRSLSTFAGHGQGGKTIIDMILKANELGVKYVSFYIFSHENNKRSLKEKLYLAQVLKRTCKEDVKKLLDIEAKISLFGIYPDFVDEELFSAIEDLENKSAQNLGIRVCLYFGYSGRIEILNAVKKCCQDCLDGKIKINEISDEIFRSKLYAKDVPDPDILIRTSGEQRISNFLLWQIAYSELFFVDKMWPDFSGEDLDEIIRQYQHRERRYGS